MDIFQYFRCCFLSGRNDITVHHHYDGNSGNNTSTYVLGRENEKPEETPRFFFNFDARPLCLIFFVSRPRSRPSILPSPFLVLQAYFTFP